ncbi:hypothetical protein, partial [Cellulomonas carbonis]
MRDARRVAAHGAAAIAVTVALTGGTVHDESRASAPERAVVRSSPQEVVAARLDAQVAAWADRRRGDALAIADAALDASHAASAVATDEALTAELATASATLTDALRRAGWSRVDVVRVTSPTAAWQPDAVRLPTRPAGATQADLATAQTLQGLADDVFRLSVLVEAAGRAQVGGPGELV